MPFPLAENFSRLRRRNKAVFVLVTMWGFITFKKGMFGLSQIVIDEWIFHGHLFWSSVFSIFLSVLILSTAGLLLIKLGGFKRPWAYFGHHGGGGS